LSNVENPPLRFPIGKDSVQRVKLQLGLVKADVEKYESWSEDLAFD